MRSHYRHLIAALLILATPVFAAAQEPATPAPRTLVVIGTGEATMKPDLAIASFTVLRSAKTARAALDQANAAMREVTAGMRQLGVEDRDLQTSGFSIAPQYRYDNDRQDGTQNPPAIVGYEVRNTLTVRVRDIAALGQILDRAVTLGVNQGGEISFDVAEPRQARDAARKKAVADAIATASVLAEAAGVTLGPVREISEDVAVLPPMPLNRSMKMMAAEAAPSVVPVETGESTFSASVRMVYDISD
ncbi:MAG TPA: SIMPL domain-containing protein [Aurantimonas sp.]|uniref:SIMPL domain-containing protein n=1 Tax=Aurantimonas marianensis TaxID=2920428 RepID=A0A9X2H6F4_9HYPH|nr:SIMPL domain-containing protein [Aurantimonas marianensis]MCP3055066.1 SIMPL domain-containing protein [Aurantimonas marianensis]